MARQTTGKGRRAVTRMTAEDLQLSQYKIVRRLGAGGMAEVFLADKVGAAGFSRRVAIKTILAGNTPHESISLFLDEARVASFLQHSGIVQTLDLGFESDTLFIAMEYVAGPTLSRLVYDLKRMGGLLPWPIVAYIGAKVANALDYAHRRATDSEGKSLNLVHRDISPQNILLTREATVKLTDFGVARASIQMHKTKTGQVRGKAAYMAPEQVRAKKLDGRTDMFALGLVLYEALTGHRPFQRKADIQSMRAVLGDTPPPIHKRNSTVPEELVKVINRCIEKEPSKRYAHCGELESALREIYSVIRESDVTDKISSIMNDVFGAQTWDKQTDQEPVEAWHPTIQVDQDGKVQTPQLRRLEDTSMSQELADLLGQTPSQAQTAEMTPVSAPSHIDLRVARLNSDVGSRTEALAAATPKKLGGSRSAAPTPVSNFQYQTPSYLIRSVTGRKKTGAYILGTVVVFGCALFFVFKKTESEKHFQQRPLLIQEVEKTTQFKAVSGKPTEPQREPSKVTKEPRSESAVSKKKMAPKTVGSKPKIIRTKRSSRKKKTTEVIPSSSEAKPVVETVDLALVLDLVDRAENKGDLKLKVELEAVLLKLTENRPLTSADQKLVRMAHKKY